MALGILYIVGTYLLGSVPSAYILTKKITGKNLLQEGSGNIGSTNARRIAGKRVAIITQLFDMAKGFMPIALLLWSDSILETITFTPYFIYCVALAAILGHDFSLFLKFKGGKGVNTTLGASLLISPIPVLLSVFAYFMIKRISQTVSLGSLVLAFVLPLSSVLIYGINSDFIYFILCTILIISLHSENIKRLLKKEEFKV